MRYVDPDGRAVETAWDLFSLGTGVTSFIANVKEGNIGGAFLDGVGIVVDAAAVILPGIPGGVGAVTKGFRVGEKITDTNKIVKSLDDLPLQKHHFVTDKHSFFSPKMSKIVDKYGLKLNESWNIEKLPHQGRHPNKYHEFVEKGLKQADAESGGSKEKFLELFNKYVKEPIRNNPDLLRKKGWEN